MIKATTRRAGHGAIAAAAAALLVAGCGTVRYSAGQPARPAAHQGVRTAAGAPRVSVRLPASYGTPTFIAGSPRGAGVFVWNSTGNSGASVYFVDGRGRSRSWPVRTGPANQFQRGASGFAVHGTSVWIGLNSSVIELSTRTGRVSTWRIPAPRPLPAAYRPAPGSPGATPAVQSLAVAPDGSKVAVAMSASTGVQVLQVRTGTWSSLALPAPADEPLAVGYSASGTLGAGFGSLATGQPDGFLAVTPGGRAVVSTVRDSWEVQGYRADGFLVGATRPDLVSATGATSPLAAPGLLLDPTGPPEPAAVLPAGQLAFITARGVLRFPSDARSARSAAAAATVSAPAAVRCGRSDVSPPRAAAQAASRPGPSRSGPGRCQPRVELMTADHAGNVWVVLSDSQHTVARLSG
jgi:hypothetical protein